MQNANLLNLPENYTFKYCRLRLAMMGSYGESLTGQTSTTLSPGRNCHMLPWIHMDVSWDTYWRKCEPEPASLGAGGLCSLRQREEEPSDEPSGHVTSISVLRPYRRLGLANRLMKQARESFVD